MKKEPLKIAILGYGKMGREIEHLAEERKIEVTEIFDIDRPIYKHERHDFDVAIDFSSTDAVLKNVETLGHIKKNLVIGTTGWKDRESEVEAIVKDSGIGVVYGSNFSIGMQMFYKIVERAAQFANSVQDYDIAIHELHHKRKADSPSGTALSLADIVLKEFFRKNDILEETSHGVISPHSLHVSSMRLGEATGTHTIYIDSLADTIELTHRAKNRSGFALGALAAAQWVNGKTGFYNFQDIFEEVLKTG
ncbi:MAG TPA: 4-hydroxy-tetrahydrodipicolinate reductase [Patescibacteria group bacterium]|nr:4-hydroxy-tetrahydrodipicolinate reductase [Patescibacteria group bacterium]